MSVLRPSWKCVQVNQKDVTAGESLENIMKKKRLTKAIEPLINRMNKNVRSGRNNNKLDNEGGGVDTMGSAGQEEIDQIGKWYASFVKSLKYVE